MARILILTPQLPIPPQALTGLSQGTTIRNFNLIAGLAKRHTVDLLTFFAAGERKAEGAAEQGDEGAGSLDSLRPYCPTIVAEPAPVRTLALRARDTLLSPWPDMALRLESRALHDHLARLLRENRYDVIQAEGIEMAPYLLDCAGLGRPRQAFQEISPPAPGLR